MEIKLKQIKIINVIKNYINNDEDGVLGLDGKLNIRPKYQREFVYKDAQRDAVIDTVRKGFPLNVMYWVDGEDGTYEVLDGQQRTISICEYVAGSFSINYQYFHNLTEEEKQQILDYELQVYICKGADKEKLDWFKTINIAGEKLTDQELRNAVYTGPWLTDAKRYFSKTGCVAYAVGGDYMNGTAIRQEYLEKVIEWISNGNIEDYMAKHQLDEDANELWIYFQNVINWVKTIFPNYRKEMKGLPWGEYYNVHKDGKFNSATFENRIQELMIDEDVTNKKGIYAYLLTDKEKYLNIRAFSPKQKREIYERDNGECQICQKQITFDESEFDHKLPWSKGGHTDINNGQLLCRDCNREKSDK